MAGFLDYFRGPNPARRRGVFGGDAGLGSGDPGEATALALLNAMGPIQQAGLERSASPVGAIAKNLIPLFGAIVQGQLLQKQAAQEQEMLGLEKQKLQAETYKALREDQPKNLTEILARRVLAGQPTDDVVDLIRKTQKPAAETGTTAVIGSLRETLGREPTQTEIAQALQSQKLEVAGATAGATAQARYPWEIQKFKEEQNIKAAELKAPARQQIDSWSSGIASLNSLDNAIKGLASNSPTQLGAAMITHGMYSTDAIRDYQAFKNDWDNYRYGARGAAKAALDRINSEIPSLGLAFVDPQGFLNGLRHVRDKVQKQLATNVDAASQSVRVPPEIQKAMGATIQNQQVGLPTSKSTQIPPELDIDIPPQYATTAKQIFDDEIKSGKGAAAAALAVQSWLSSQQK